MKVKVAKRRALSPIIAELLLLALTVSIGTTFYLVGSSTVSGYGNGLSFLLGQNANAAKEVYVVEYANFASPPRHVDLTVRSVGSIETDLASVSIFNLTSTSGSTQGIFAASDLQLVGGSCSLSGRQIVIPVQQFCTLRVPFEWTQGTAYNFVLSTSRGNRIVVEEIG